MHFGKSQAQVDSQGLKDFGISRDEALHLTPCFASVLDSFCSMLQSSRKVVKKGRGKDRGGLLKMPNSAGTATKAQLPDFRASFSREESMITNGCLKSNCYCPPHKNLGLERVTHCHACKCLGFK